MTHPFESWPPWSNSNADLAAIRRGEKLPGEDWHAVSDPDDEDAKRGEEREYRHTRFGGECD